MRNVTQNYNFESENKLVFELIELYVFVKNHIVISKNVSDDVFDRLLTRYILE